MKHKLTTQFPILNFTLANKSFFKPEQNHLNSTLACKLINSTDLRPTKAFKDTIAWWNALPDEIHALWTVMQFQRACKTGMFHQAVKYPSNLASS